MKIKKNYYTMFIKLKLLLTFFFISDIYNYSLVLEYANNGSIKKYLKEHFNELEWNEKIRLALQLAKAILCLHECGIIHRDLVSIHVLYINEFLKLINFYLIIIIYIYIVFLIEACG